MRHGPKCQSKLLACSTPKCNYAVPVTGLTPKHCCKMCAGSRDHGEDWWGPTHGAQCWCLAMECSPAADDEADGVGGEQRTGAGEEEPELAADIALEVPVEESSPENAAAAAFAAAGHVEQLIFPPERPREEACEGLGLGLGLG